MPHIGFEELVVVLVILLLLFGSKKLPELSRSLGESIRELRKSFSDSGDKHPGHKDNHQA
jgi:sec-independent protein translocase protein TatA